MMAREEPIKFVLWYSDDATESIMAERAAGNQRIDSVPGEI